MGRWLAKFSADIPQSRTDNPDIVPVLPSVSGLSGPDIEVSVKILPLQPDAEPTPPLQPGWRVVYMDNQWKLAGGNDDPGHGTVQSCRWVAGDWAVHLTDGQAIPLGRIRSVAAVDWKGRCYGAWTVREHGYGGEGPAEGPLKLGQEGGGESHE